MLDVIIEEYAIRIGQRFAVSFHRTLRIPDDGRTILCLPSRYVLKVSRGVAS